MEEAEICFYTELGWLGKDFRARNKPLRSRQSFHIEGSFKTLRIYTCPSLNNISESVTQFLLTMGYGRLSQCLNRFLNVKEVIVAFIKEKALVGLVGAFSVIVEL